MQHTSFPSLLKTWEVERGQFYDFVPSLSREPRDQSFTARVGCLGQSCMKSCSSLCRFPDRFSPSQIKTKMKGIPKVRQSSNLKLKLSGTTIQEGQELLYPSQYKRPLGAEVQEEMSRFAECPKRDLPVFKTPRNLSTHLSTNAAGRKAESTLHSPAR
ncbi:hypothetical protein TNCV_3874731 [Trichonephila clavipes]|nr:hypothetical protein TNCV_3874731 [Trichonephila clavipes]